MQSMVLPASSAKKLKSHGINVFEPNFGWTLIRLHGALIIFSPDTHMQRLFARLPADKVHTYGLVLSATGIAHQVHRQGDLWSLSVYPSHRSAAIEAISLYLKENPRPFPTRRSVFGRGAKTYSAWYVAAVLVLIHVLIATGAEQNLFVAAFGADAARIGAGELFRCVTALLLHADGQHLLGNVAGLLLFGTVVASLCGWGLGWLLILATGFFGNLFTALWYRQNHLAIGASTALFGAVAICTVLSLRIGMWDKQRFAQRGWRRWMPLAGGLALLSLLGTSPHADLLAHLLGFLSGLVIGAIAVMRHGRLPYQTSGWVQWVSAVAAIIIVAACWLRGLGYNG